MQSAVRFNAEVGEDRIVQLPAEVPPGRAEIIVLMSAPARSPSTAGLAPLIGLLRTAQAPPSDVEVQAMLDEARTARGGR